MSTRKIKRDGLKFLILAVFLASVDSKKKHHHHDVATVPPTLSPTPAAQPDSANRTVFPTAAPTTQNSTNTTTPAPSTPDSNNTASPTVAPTPSNSTTPSPTLAPTTPAPTLSPTPPPSPEPSFAPSAAPKHHHHKLSFWKILGKTIAWCIIILLLFLAFGAIMSNRYRIFYLLRGVWYSLLALDCTQWLLQKLGMSAGYYQPMDTSLNTIIFDNEMSEGLLLRETDT